MTEEKWLATTDPEVLLEFVKGAVSDRRLRLIAGELCLDFAALDHDTYQGEPSQTTQELAEESSTRRCRPECWIITPTSSEDELPHVLLREDAFSAAAGVVNALAKIIRNAIFNRHYIQPNFDDEGFVAETTAATERLQTAEVRLLHDTLGNPFRPVLADPSWLTPTVVALSRQMYAARDFSPMPILADALQDAGCSNTNVLDHCRRPGSHVRGCWVVDLVLGEE